MRIIEGRIKRIKLATSIYTTVGQNGVIISKGELKEDKLAHGEFTLRKLNGGKLIGLERTSDKLNNLGVL